MKDFTKITEKMCVDNELYSTDDLKNILSEKVYNYLTLEIADCDITLLQSLWNCESPVEQLLAIAMQSINLTGIFNFNPFIDVITIENQKEIIVCDNKYRVDFYIPVYYKNQENKFFIIECDGHEFHQKTKKQVESDNERQRNLQRAGYEIIRFSGTEIWHRPYRCAMEILHIIESYCEYRGRK